MRSGSARGWVAVEDLHAGRVAKFASFIHHDIAQNLSHFLDSVFGEQVIQGAQELGDLLICLNRKSSRNSGRKSGRKSGFLGSHN
jgi:hypothetical protein